MPQLTKGVYGTEFNATQNAPLGLRCGQMKAGNKITHNHGWYNKFGERLGFGDLSADDFQRIMTEIEGDELFITLGEEDSHHGLMSDHPELEYDAPGVDYIVQHCRYVVRRGQCLRVDEVRPDNSLFLHNGINFTITSKEGVRKILTEHSSR
ncbi:MAG: hypothetical protein V4690_03545 [Patescibacteria group bacterium]